MDSAIRMVRVSLDYPTSAICNEAGRATLADKLVSRVSTLNKMWKLCAETVDGEATCMF